MMFKNLNLYLASLVATLTSALFGYTVGLVGGLIVLPSFLDHFRLSALSNAALGSAQAQIVTVWLVGALLGVPLGMPVCSRLGRRVCLMQSATLYLVGAGLQLVGDDISVFEVGRFINGLGVGVGTLVGPMYISEISPPSKRGMLMSGYQTLLQISALAGFWGAYAANSFIRNTSSLQWRVLIFVQLIPAILLSIGICLIPETPQFLATRKKWSAVAESISWLRSIPQNDSEVINAVTEIETTIDLQSQTEEQFHANFLEEAIRKPNRKRLFVGIGLMIAQNMVGLNALNYYAPVIFMSAGFKSVSYSLFLTGLFGIVKLISAITFMFWFTHVKGNRFWLKLGSCICGASMLVLAYCVKTMTTEPPTDGDSGFTFRGAVSVFMVYVFAFAFGVSLGPISWNVCAEIFPLYINAKCCAVTTCTQWLFQIVIAGITPRLITSVGWVTYLLYAICCIASYVWITLYVPETRGVPLGKAMDALFEDTHSSEVSPSAQRRLPMDEIAVLNDGASTDESTALLHKEHERQRRRGSFAGGV